MKCFFNKCFLSDISTFLHSVLWVYFTPLYVHVIGWAWFPMLLLSSHLFWTAHGYWLFQSYLHAKYRYKYSENIAGKYHNCELDHETEKNRIIFFSINVGEIIHSYTSNYYFEFPLRQCYTSIVTCKLLIRICL